MLEQEIAPNGGAVLADGSDYLFDAPEVQAEVLLSKGVVLTHVFRKPTLQDHLNREKAIRRVSRVSNNQEITSDSNESDGNSEFYNELIIRASARKGGDVLAEYDADKCKEFSFEAKDKAIGQMYAGYFEVEEDEDPLAKLFEREGTLVVRHEIGEEGAASYVVKYTLKIPTKSQRQEYLAGSFQVKRKVEKRKTTLQTVFNLNKGLKLFNSLLVSVEGGRIQRGTYAPELREDFIPQIDPVFANSVADCAVSYYDQSQD